MALNFNAIQRAAAFAPATAFPLDARSYFESYDLAVAAAATAAEPGTDAASNTVYYFGETLVVNEGGKATLYIIQPNGTLKEVGSVPVGDGKSIEVVNGQIKLKGFGTGYYQYNTNYVPGSTEEGTKDQYIFVEEGFKAGLQPQVVAKASGDGFEIAWYEPNPTTVEGLQSQITALDGSVNNLASKVDTKADASSLALYQTRALPSIEGYASAQLSVEGALAEVMGKAMSNAGGITAIEGRVSTVEGKVSTLENTYASTTYVNEAISGLASVYETVSNVDSKLGNYYTSTQADAKFETIANVSAKLSNYYTKEQADANFMTEQEVDDRVNKVITDAVEGDTLTSLTEIVEYINTHGGEASAMMSAIDTLEDKVDVIEGQLSGIGQLEGDVKKYVDDKVSGLNISDYAKASDLQTVSGKVSTLEGKVSTIEGWAASTISAADITKWNAAEENAHNSAVASASAMVAEEASIRASADDALSARIDAEVSARISGDNALSGRLDLIEAKPFDTYASISYVEGEISKLDAAIKAETSRATGAEASLATRLELVEDSLGLGGEGNHGGVAEQIATIIREVWGANASAENLAEASSRIDDHEGRIGAIEDKVTNTLATKEYVKEQIQSAEHVISVKTDDTDFFEITKDQDDIVTINVKDDIENIIADAVTSVVSGGQYVSATISSHGLNIDDSNLVSALSNRLQGVAATRVSEGSIGFYGELIVTDGKGSITSYNLTDTIFGCSALPSSASTLLTSAGDISFLAEFVSNASYTGEYAAQAIWDAAMFRSTLDGVSGGEIVSAVSFYNGNSSNIVTSVSGGENLHANIDSNVLLLSVNTSVLASQLVTYEGSTLASGIASQLPSDIIKEHVFGTSSIASNAVALVSSAEIVSALDDLGHNHDAIKSTVQKAVTSVQTSTLVVSHVGNNLTINLPSEIWLDGGNAAGAYEAEEAVYNELLNNEYGN